MPGVSGGDSAWRAWWRRRRRRAAARVRLLVRRYSRVLWAVHSAWALLTGIAVLVLAHNRYGFLRWVVIFIALTWGSTLFVSRVAMSGQSRAMQFARSVVSYFTRVMYQETLFFLIPFYFYSTTFPSWNCAYLVILCGLAILSCFDLVFDRLLRENTAFAVGFFAFVSFSALQFFIPLLLRIRVDNGAYIAAGMAFAAAALLVLRWDGLRQPRRLAFLVVGTVAALIAVRLMRPLLPPVPLRLTAVRFSAALDPRTLLAPLQYRDEIPIRTLRNGRLYAVATVFSPSRVPVRIQMRFLHDGKLLRSSRTAQLTANANGFRVWDSLRAPPAGFERGTYRVEVWTGAGQLVGRKAVRLTD
jgi:Family of unknown function (DUF5924)